jgi:hypothetical protein
MRRIRLIVGISGLVGLVLAGLALVLLPKKRSAEAEARNLAYTLVSADADALARFVYDDELAQIDMSRTELRQFLAEYVCPKIKGSRLKELATSSHRTNSMGYADMVVTTPRGKSFTMRTGVQDADMGYVCRLQTMVRLAWRVAYLDRHDVKDTTHLGHLSTGYFLEHDQETLKKYGYAAIPSLTGSQATPFSKSLAFQKKYCSARGLAW